MIERTYLEYREAIQRMDQANSKRSDGAVDLAEEQNSLESGFPGDARCAIDLMGDDTIKCTRCPADIGQGDRVGTDLVCPGCYNTIPDRELREILSRPKCLQEVPHG